MIIKVITKSRAKASGIKLVEEPTAEDIDIRADYVAKYGAPSAAAPKIFFRYTTSTAAPARSPAPCWQKSSGPLVRIHIGKGDAGISKGTDGNIVCAGADYALTVLRNQRDARAHAVFIDIVQCLLIGIERE